MRTAIWRSQIAQTATSIDGLVPVIKGNGYGFGRRRLAELAADFADAIAVGTVHELDDLPDAFDVVVLTPTLTAPADERPILTVGRPEHVAALAGWRGRVIVKLQTELRRYGGDRSVIDAALAAGLDVIGVGLHPPIAGTDAERVDQIMSSLVDVDPSIDVWVSHLGATAYALLPTTHRYRIRIGTALWHGDKSALHLDAEVLHVRAVSAGERAGYQQGIIPSPGHLVMIGAGTANGVTPLADGRSPFHFGRERMALHEPPHMHTSMAFVGQGRPLPELGEWVDVQRPLHMTSVDEYRWL